MHRLRALIIALLLALVVTAPASAQITTKGQQWKWAPAGGYNHMVIVCHWATHPLPGGYGGAYWEAMHRSVDRWNTMNGELRYSLSATPCGSSIPEPYIAIGWYYTGPEIAFTNIFTEFCTDTFVCTRHADLTLNPNVAWATGTPGPSTYDAETAFLHELGHPMQLVHSNDPNDVMYPTLNPGATHRWLSADDQTSYAAYYGRSH